MKIVILTNEYPPYVYGGAGVHVEYLSKELAALEEGRHEVRVLSFGDQRESAPGLTVEGITPGCMIPSNDPRHQKLLDTLQRNLFMAGALQAADIIHCHTWYTHLAGCLSKQLLQAPLVLTTHSLEPHRPWKEEQLGSAYNATCWLEKTAYDNADGVIAVSRSMKRDVHELYGVPEEKIRIIHNGIDLKRYRPTPDASLLAEYGIHPDRPFILFVGRITRQKGIIHLVNAVKYLDPGVQIVLCAGAPDTEEIGREMTESVDRARRETTNEIIWIPEFLPKDHIIRMNSHASLFVCPSIYEPFGIINLEAMACETPVVATAVGGIPEVVVHNETGLLVPFEPMSPTSFEPREPDKFARNLASAINAILASPHTLQRMGINARKRVEEQFSWESIANQTLRFYKDLAALGKAS